MARELKAPEDDYRDEVAGLERARRGVEAAVHGHRGLERLLYLRIRQRLDKSARLQFVYQLHFGLC